MLGRCAEYARRFGMSAPIDLSPVEHQEGGKRWVYPVMERVIAGIEGGDPACAEIGVEFIEEGTSFPFDMRLKYNTARALRRATLDDGQRERVRRRVVELLRAANLPPRIPPVRGRCPIKSVTRYSYISTPIGCHTYCPRRILMGFHALSTRRMSAKLSRRIS